MSSHLRLRRSLFGGTRGRVRGLRFPAVIALGAAFWLVSDAGAILSAGQTAQPPASQANQTAAPKPRAAAGAAKGEATPPSPKGMSYHTTTDRSAVWVGDQFHYYITVDYSSDYEFVLDNLNKENVNMDPFPVIDVQKTVTPYASNQSRLVVDITLANFSLVQTDARVPQLTLYYFRRDQHTGGAEQAAAESLAVVGPMIALRSALPANPPDMRDSMSMVGWQSSRWVVPVVGYTALALLLAGLGWEAFLFVKRRQTKQGPDRWASMETVRNRWVRSVPSDFSNSSATKEFLNRSYVDVKEYLGYYLDTDAVSLTAEEVQQEMQRSGAGGEISQKAARVLNACETARYSRNGVSAEADARGIAQDVRELLNLAPKE